MTRLGWELLVCYPIWFAGTLLQPGPGTVKVYCALSTHSTISIKGRTNVSSFECQSNAHAISREAALLFEGGGARLTFRDARLVVVASQLDCGLEAMNSDLRQALKVDRYPLIYIDLIRVRNESCEMLQPGEPPKWYELEVKAHIAGMRRTLYPKVAAQIVEPGLLRLQGDITLHLPDFGIEPPAALWGMVRVAPDIEVTYDLLVHYQLQ